MNTQTKYHFRALFFYVVFFLALFIQFPLKGALPGNCDFIAFIALSNIRLQRIFSLFTNHPIGSTIFPDDNIFAYGEPYIGEGVIFALFKLLGFDDIWASYFLIAIFFALTAFGIYLLATLFVRPLFAWCAGFAFSCSNHALANLDDAYVTFYFLPAIALYFLFRFSNERKNYLFYGAAIVAGLQIYFSVYVFVYQSLALLIVFFFNVRFSDQKISVKDRQALLKGILIFLLVIAPFMVFYLSAYFMRNFVSYADFDVVKMLRIRLFSPVYVLENNLIYPEMIHFKHTYALLVRYKAFSGIMLMILALFSLRKLNKIKWQFVIIALLGIILSIGPVYNIGQKEYLTPIGYLFLKFPFLQFLRLSMRAYFLVTLALSILAVMTLEGLPHYLNRKFKLKTFFVALAFLLIHFFENTPFPLKAFAMRDLIQIPQDYQTFTKNLKNEVILDLPTSFKMRYLNWDELKFGDPYQFLRKKPGQPQLKIYGNTAYGYDADPLFDYNRNMFYMNWQAYHRLPIVLGINSYLPYSRVIFQYYIDKIPQPTALYWLREKGVTLLVFHKNMSLKGGGAADKQLLKYMENSPLLNKVYEGSQSVFFRFNL